MVKILHFVQDDKPWRFFSSLSNRPRVSGVSFVQRLTCRGTPYFPPPFPKFVIALFYFLGFSDESMISTAPNITRASPPITKGKAKSRIFKFAECCPGVTMEPVPSSV